MRHIAIALLLLASASAKAETIGCTPVGSLPAVLSAQGVYCLTQDLSTTITTGAAIRIDANNVILDCNGHKVGGLAAGPGTQARGIYASGPPPGYRSNVTVRNCAVRGFARGIEMLGSGHVAEGNRLDSNTVVGIRVSGDDGLIRNNLVRDTGGNTMNEAPIGIEAVLDVEVRDNLVAHVFATPGSNDTATGIYTQADRFGVVTGNRVRDLVADGSGSRWGVFAFSAGRLLLRGNHLVNNRTPGAGSSSGITCNQTDDALVVDNIINAFAFAMPGCTNGGGNVVVAP